MTGRPAPYSVDLCQHLAECDTNYLRLCKLMPEMSSSEGRRIVISSGGSRETVVSIEVQDQAPYTSTLVLRQSGSIWGGQAPQMTVRVYHDARMAEVISYQMVRVVKGRYEFPNPRMHARDEKRQLNRLLGEWLTMCLVHGREPEPVLLS